MHQSSQGSHVAESHAGIPNPIFTGVDDDDEIDEMDVASGEEEFLFGDTKDDDDDMFGHGGLFMMRAKLPKHTCVQCGSRESREPIVVFETRVFQFGLISVCYATCMLHL